MVNIFRSRKAGIVQSLDVIRGILIILAVIFVSYMFNLANSDPGELQKKDTENQIERIGALNYFLKSPLASFDTSGFTVQERQAFDSVFRMMPNPVVSDVFILRKMEAKSAAIYHPLLQRLFDSDSQLKGFKINFMEEVVQYASEAGPTEYRSIGSLPQCSKIRSDEIYLPGVYSGRLETARLLIEYCFDEKKK